MIRHLLSPTGDGEHAFCGDAFDIYESGDAEEPSEFMRASDTRSVTCPRCCEEIVGIRAVLKGRKLSPATLRKDEETP